MTYGVKYIQAGHFGGAIKSKRGYEGWEEKGFATLNEAYKYKERWCKDSQPPMTYYYVVEEEETDETND